MLVDVDFSQLKSVPLKRDFRFIAKMAALPGVKNRLGNRHFGHLVLSPYLILRCLRARRFPRLSKPQATIVRT